MSAVTAQQNDKLLILTNTLGIVSFLHKNSSFCDLSCQTIVAFVTNICLGLKRENRK